MVGPLRTFLLAVPVVSTPTFLNIHLNRDTISADPSRNLVPPVDDHIELEDQKSTYHSREAQQDPL